MESEIQALISPKITRNKCPTLKIIIERNGSKWNHGLLRILGMLHFNIPLAL